MATWEVRTGLKQSKDSGVVFFQMLQNKSMELTVSRNVEAKHTFLLCSQMLEEVAQSGCAASFLEDTPGIFQGQCFLVFGLRFLEDKMPVCSL